MMIDAAAKKERALIDAALKILAPDKTERTECVEVIKDALLEIDFLSGQSRAVKARPSKRKLNSYIAALTRAKNTLPDFQAERFLRPILEKEIERWKTISQRKRPTGKGHLAAEYARNLLIKYGHKPTTTRATRGGLWCQLAAVLCGEDPKEDTLYHQVCAIQKGQNRR